MKLFKTQKNYFAFVFNSLINRGISNELSFTEAKKVKLLNTFALLSTLVITVLIAFFIASGLFEGLYFEIPNMIAFLSIYSLSAKGRHLASRYFFSFYFPLYLLGTSLIVGDEASKVELLLLSTSLMIVFLFDKIKQSLPLTLYCLILFTIGKLVQNSPIYLPIAEAPKYTPVYFFEITLAFGVIFIIANLFKKEHERFETIITQTNQELKQRNQDVHESIEYAKRIQLSVLPRMDTMQKLMPNSFIFYRPKDVVSGDFYWFHELSEEEYIIACGDCTGHGVPGAMMTVMGTSLLNQIVVDKKIHEPSAILRELDVNIHMTLKQNFSDNQSVSDGMDLTLLSVNKRSKEIIFCAAKRNAIFFKNGAMNLVKGSKFSIGGSFLSDKEFTQQLLHYENNDMLYLFTDGYCDQFGGPKEKKINSSGLYRLLDSLKDFGMKEQNAAISDYFNNWKGSIEQIDDVLIIGIRL